MIAGFSLLGRDRTTVRRLIDSWRCWRHGHAWHLFTVNTWPGGQLTAVDFCLRGTCTALRRRGLTDVELDEHERRMEDEPDYEPGD